MDQALASITHEQSPSFRKAALGFFGSLTLMITVMVAAGTVGA
jgi:hypothetical protein